MLHARSSRSIDFGSLDLIHTKEHSDRALVVRIALFCFNGRLLMLKRRHPDFEPLARVWLAQINALDRLRNEQVRHGIPPPSMADATPRVQKKKPPEQEATAPPLLTTVEATAPLLLTTTAAAPVAGASGAGSSTGDGGDCGGSVTSPIGPRRSVTYLSPGRRMPQAYGTHCWLRRWRRSHLLRVRRGSTKV